MQYAEFIESKKKTHPRSGFDVNELHPALFPFQSFVVKRALKKGKYALFEDCGLGKTIQQLVWAQEVARHTQKPVLILAPLAVVNQTKAEAGKFNIPLDSIVITNYEQLEHINADDYSGIVLDESSILKNFDGAYKKQLINMFAATPYKLACTATPSPNDEVELTNHAEFLGIMKRGEVLATYFVHDGGDGSYRIKRHAIKEYWSFVSSWASMLSMPSDIGFSNDGYILPGINYTERQIKTEKRDNGMMFNNVAVSSTTHGAELRLTKIERLSQAAEIANNSDEQFIIWVKLNEEEDTLRQMIPDAVVVTGSDSSEDKSRKLLEFAQGKFRVLITKLKIASFGMNFQNCHNQIFASLDFSFEGLYQGIRRSYRFGQRHPVNIYLITTDTMENVISAIKRKQKQFEDMQHQMQENMNEVFDQKHSQEVKFEEYKSDNIHIQRGDCVQLIQNVPNKSIHFSIFSPPFVDLFTYSDHIEDMGNSKDYKEFLSQFAFLVRELYRVLIDGRNVAVHCMDLPIQKGKEGYIGLRDFSGMILRAFEDAGFIYHSRVTIWKNPVTEMQRTKALGLLHKQIKKDATMSRVGVPDYLLVFRKPGEGTAPVTHQDKDNSALDYLPVDTWQKYASPVWMDIDYSDTLNFRSARDERDEKHICPLQLPTIERAIHLWTNEGDTVLTPFLGIGSEVYQAVKMKRKGIGFELKQSYYEMAVKNCKEVEQLNKQKSMF